MKSPSTKKEIWKLCNRYGIYGYTINEDDMSIDINDDVNISHKGLDKISLKFRNVGGHFSCYHNYLKNLEGSPINMVGFFNFTGNNLTSLKGGPINVSGSFDCSYNKLYSLEGMPKYISGNIYINYNNIKDFRGFPEDWEGHLIYGNNPVSSILDLFSEYLKANKIYKAIHLLNDFDVIQGDNVVMDRLEEVFIQLGLEVPDIKIIKGYNII